MIKIKGASLALVLGFSFFLSSVSFAKIVEKIVAVVNQEVILSGDIYRFRSQLKKKQFCR